MGSDLDGDGLFTVMSPASALRRGAMYISGHAIHTSTIAYMFAMQQRGACHLISHMLPLDSMVIQ